MAEVNRERELAAYLAEAARRPLEWGVFDCAIGLVAGWVLRVRGNDPAAHLQGRYRTPVGAARLICRAGGLASLVGSCAARAGIPETDVPVLGDVGVVRWPGGAELCAIRTNIGWAGLRPDHGIAVGPAPTVRAWRI